MNRSITPLVSAAIIIFSLAICSSASAQLESLENLEEVSKKGFFKEYFGELFKGFTDFGDPFTLNGGVGLNMRSYSASGLQNRQDPFLYTLNGNLNTRIYKVNIPISFLVTAKNRESSLPNWNEIKNAFKPDFRSQRDRFVRFGMSPTYKWIKLHLGHRAMDFSQYTLSNFNFYGVGAELTPGNFRLSLMNGRLQKAQPVDLSLVEPNVPIYERTGYGAKVGYGTEDSSVDLILFKAQDDVNSIDIIDGIVDPLSPQENLTLGVNLEHLFLKKFRFNVEYALSTFSPNALDEMNSESSFPNFLIDNRMTTERRDALDAKLDFEVSDYTLGLQFKQIDPNYQTLGAYFFNNDIREYLGNVGFDMFNQSTNVRLSAGVQTNNLDNTKEATTSRLVYTGDVAYAKEAFNANINYSNNTTDVGYVLNPSLDSLNAVIITQSAGINLSFNMVSDSSATAQTIVVGANIQDVSDEISDPFNSAASTMWIAHAIYSLAFTESKWKLSLRTNYNQNEIQQMQINRLGFGAGLSKTFNEDKINLGLDINYFINSNENSGNSTNLIPQFKAGIKFSESITTNLSLNMLRTTADATDPFTELIGNLGVHYNFAYAPSRRAEEQEVKAQQ